MKIICLVKFIPDVDNFIYDFEKNVLVRENVNLILNPDDACALAFALKRKEQHPDCFIEIVTMAPLSVISLVEDLLRRGADKATILSDKLYVGSDTYITSKILSKYLEGQSYDCILTGTHSLDGDTSHIPAQLGEILRLSQLSNIIKIEETLFCKDSAVVEVDNETVFSKYEIELPAILSFEKESNYKLPYVKFKDLDLDVSQQLSILSNCELAFEEENVGIKGSLTKVAKTYVKKMDRKDKLVVGNDGEGIEIVYAFLKNKGFL